MKKLNVITSVFISCLILLQPLFISALHWKKFGVALLLDFLIPSVYAQTTEELLKSTPDANTIDPYIVQKAAELENDPARIFAFVRDEIGYESYNGSLRGARGVLWSKAGNALDQASLLIALLRASNVPARYLSGTLSDEQAKKLILSMFPLPTRVVGCPPEDVKRADPANDPQLLAETKEHYWVEFGSGLTAADPTFRSAQIGQTFTAAKSTFTEVPDSLRYKATVRLKAEFPSGIAGTAGFETTTPLNKTFNIVELVGKPFSIGHFVNSFSPPALFFGYTIHTYSPYILIGQNDLNIADNEIIRGVDYQEILTNYPLASQFLTGLFFEIDVKSPDGRMETYERTLFDRIGFATRQNGGSISLGNSADQGPALSDMDLVTINVLPGLQSLDVIADQKDRVESLQTQLSEIKPLIDSIPPSGPQTGEQCTALSKAINLTRETLVLNGEILTMAFAGASDVALHQLEQGYLTKGYYISPRLLLTLTKREGDNFSVKLDLRKNDLRAVPAPGQVAGIDFAFEMARGLMESTLEGVVFSQVTGMQGISVADIFGNLGEDTSLALITANNLQLLETTALSATAKARISQAAGAGETVLTPTRMVTIGDLTTVGWLEIDFLNGHTIGVMEDGGHQSIFEYPILPSTPANIVSGAFIGFELGFVQGNIIFIGNFLTEVSAGTTFLEAVRNSKLAVVSEMLDQYFSKLRDIGEQNEGGQFWSLVNRVTLCLPEYKSNPPEGLKCIIEAYQEEGFVLPAEIDLPIFAYTFVGMGTALAWINRNAPSDPQVFPFLSSDLGPGPASVLPGTVPSVEAQIVPDDFFTIPVNGVEVPSVFKAQIQNLGPAADTFALSFSNVPTGFNIQSSVPAITIPPGETAEVGICVEPVGQIPPSGTPVPFSINVDSTTNPSVSAVASQTFIASEIPAIALSYNPALLSSTPGTPASTTLTLRSVGNVPAGDVALAINTPPGLTVSGLTSPVTLGEGESTTQELTLTPAANTPLNSMLTATITATFGSVSGQPQTDGAQVNLSIKPAETIAVEQAALAALQTQNSQLAANLSSLAGTFGQLQSAPTDKRLWERATLRLTNIYILAQSDSDLLEFVPQIQEARNLAATQNLSPLQGLVHILFSGIRDVFEQEARHAFTLALSPANVELQPGQDQTFIVRIENQGTASTTVTVKVDPLPAGVTADLSQTQITLAPGEVSDTFSNAPIILTLSQSVQSVKTFSLRLSGTVAGADALTQRASAYVVIRPAIADVLSISANPSVVEPGTPVAISAQILNTANTIRPVLARVEVRDQADMMVAILPDISLTLMPGTNTITTNLGTFLTDGLPNGLYWLHVSLRGSDGGLLPGRAAQTILFAGMPVSATIRAMPSLLAPGTVEVATTIEVTNQIVQEGGSPISFGTEINTAIQKGLSYLYNTRQVNQKQGYDEVYWSYGGYEQAATGAVVFAMLSQKNLWETNAVEYQDAIDSAMNYLLSVAATFTVSIRDDGFNPCGTDTCLGVYWPAANNEITYTTGLIAPAIALYAADHANDVATPSGPLANLTWGEIAQGITNMFAVSQSTASSGNRRGGWRYYPGNRDSDSSTTQWAVISMIYDQNLGATTPQFVKDELKYWLAAVQYIDPTQSAWNGVACYQPGVQPCDHSDTGGLLLGLNFVGYDQNNFQVQAALDFLNTNWTQTANGTWYGNFGHPYAMWSVYKGLEVTIGLDDTTYITNLLFGQCGGSSNCNWWQDYNNWLVATQNVDGSWSGTDYWVGPLATAFNLSILGGVNIPTIYLNLSVKHQLPSSGYIIKPASVSPVAESLSASEVVWETQTFNTRTTTFQLVGLASDLIPGESRQLSLGTEIIAEVITAGGERITVPINLPPVVIAVTHMVGLAQPSQTIGRGAEALYNVRITNSTGTEETFALSTIGLEEFSTTLTSSITIPAGQTINIPLIVAVPAGVPERIQTFCIQAQMTSAILDTVEGQLIIQGGDSGGPSPSASLASMAVSMDIIPVQPIAGQGSMATYRVIVTNMGNNVDSYDLSVTLPEGFAAIFSQNRVDVPPGLENFREVRLTLIPQQGTAAGDYAFTVTAVSVTESSVNDQVSSTITVSANGVDVEISPASSVPESTFQLTIINTGEMEDTFDLSLSGPLAPSAKLDSNAVTLSPGASMTVPITLDQIDFVYPDTMNLTATATSRGNTAVQESASALVTISETKGVAANFDPVLVELTSLGPAASLLLVHNISNKEDAYTAAIIDTSGPVTANFKGLNGQLTQTVPLFRLPGLSTGAIQLNADLTGFGKSTITVKVTSLSNASVNATASTVICMVNQKPIANAGPDQMVDEGSSVILDGAASFDPDGDTLTYVWMQIDGPPIILSDANTAQPVFTTPDVSRTGAALTFALTVSDGKSEATDTVDISIRFVNLPPIANAGKDQSVSEMTPVVLDGSASSDPDGDSLSYEWKQLEGTEVILNLIDPVHPTFLAPNVPLDGATLTFELIVNDGELTSNSDAVNVTVKDVNHPPVSRAGTEQTVRDGAQVMLDGSASYDQDEDTLTYLWTQTAGPPVALSDTAAVQPTFIAPSVSVRTTLTFELAVSDGFAETTDEVNIIVENLNHQPVSDAGLNQMVDEGTLVILDGTGSNDPDGDTLFYIWVQTKGTLVELSGVNTSNPSFTAPFVGRGGEQLSFSLTVYDGDLISTPTEVAVYVHDVKGPPACGAAQASPALLWPPNHKMKQVKIVGVSDPDDDQVSLSIIGVTQDEPVNNLGDGDTSPDAVIQGNNVLLRMERSGSGDGRVYKVKFLAVDELSQNCQGQVQVCVPQNHAKTCVDNGQNFDSTGP